MAWSLLESSALTEEEYAAILQALEKCEQFRTQRNLSIDRFAVDDPRTLEQLEEEDLMTKRLKQAYKAAKLHAAKKKEKKAE
jgi:hypothetical protein